MTDKKSSPNPLTSRASKEEGTKVAAGSAVFGAEKLVVIAGPCAVETEEQVLTIAERVKAAGATALRGGAYKPRSSPYSFQGLEEAGLLILKSVREKTGLPIVTEIMDARTIPLFLKHDIDVLQVGARNMQNFTLLKELGQIRKPILLKRGFGATVAELISAAEYILHGGNPNVILCERGINTFERSTRSTLDISAIPVLKKETHLPVIVDPSHAAGRPDIIPALARAAVAAGADGLIVEVHHDPSHALCDGAQALLPDGFASMMEDIRRVAQAVGRSA
jgi:3-deoxy-7-phosphoheptulonate synthase